MRKTIYNIIMCGSLLTIAGCSSDTDNGTFVAPTDKQPIELCVGVDNAMTRAVVTDGTDKTLKAFTAPTGLWMVMKSEFAPLSGDPESLNDLDFKGNNATSYCVTYATTGDKVTDKEENKVNFTAENTRYWDDAHARSSKLSVWAIAVPGKTGNLKANPSAKTWTATAELTTVNWTITPAQNATTVAAEDLCFSNNIADNTTYEKFDARMKFNTNPRGFDKGKLIFYHALTKITVRLVEGKGFDTSSDSDFKLDNIAIKGFKLSGTFDVAQGEFSSTGEVTKITSMYNKGKVGNATHYLEALVMPGTDLSSLNLTDAISFSVDKNPFKVSSATLLEKVRNGISDQSWTTMEAGKNYVFTFTINKTGIKVTATIAPWETVTAETAYPKINISEVYGHKASDDECKDLQKGFSFYRSTTVNGDYTFGSDVTYAETPATGHRNYEFKTPLYWPNHETHYFFRGVYPLVGSESDQTPTANVSASAITVANSGYTANTFPSDLMLGYPRNTDGTADEACKVHENTQGICATEGDIRMNFQYVMSQVEVQLTTNTAVGATDAVKLDGNTEIAIIGGYSSGTIALANGAATCTGEKGTYTMSGTNTTISNAYDRRDAIIPQFLTDLQFRIKVDGGNGTYDYYYATIADVEVTPAGGTKGKITKWEPGKMYIYKLKVTKTGIKITATLKDWETVTSDENHIWM